MSIAKCIGFTNDDVCCGFKLMVHNFVRGQRKPVIIGVLLLVMVTVVAVKVASQPWSHNCPMERRLPAIKSGKMCHWIAVSGRPGSNSSAV